jgi:TusA-related sulfurtransferase
MSGEPVVDARGELCPGPVLKVEGFLRRSTARAPFRVLVDHRASAEALAAVAFRHRFRLELEDSEGELSVRFVPAEA